ncbi:hypothetical protein [Limimaricola cinnabarinus]|uniref:hypothetical protein n=1 Tax=Limimaricola cinnabarinus TaxID=1125964 RepID=UPI0039E64AE5
MTGFFRFVWHRHRRLGLVTLVAFGMLIFFAADFAGEAIYFANPANRDRPVEPWMSIRYVERSWDLTKPVIFDIIGYDVDTPPDAVPRSVAEFLRESGMTLPEFQARIEEAQQLLREQRNR